MPVALTRKGLHSETVFKPNMRTYIQIDQYQRIKPENKLVPYLPRLYNNVSWQIDEQESIRINDLKARWTVYHSKIGGQSVAQVQWFTVGRFRTESMMYAKILQIPAYINGENFFNIYTLQTICVEYNCNAARQLLTNHAAAINIH